MACAKCLTLGWKVWVQWMAMLRCSVLNQDNLLLNISVYILHTVLITFSMMIKRRICIKWLNLFHDLNVLLLKGEMRWYSLFSVKELRGHTSLGGVWILAFFQGSVIKCWGVTLGWTTITFRRESQCTKSLHGTEIGKSFGWIGLLA